MLNNKKANSWKAFYANHEANEELNKHLASIAVLSTYGMDPQDCFMTMTAQESGLLLLTLSPNKTELLLYHQLKVLGGTATQPTHAYVSLSDFDCKAATAKLDITSSLRDVDVNTPDWNHFAALEDSEKEFKQLEPQEHAQVILQCKNLIPILPDLAKVFIHLSEMDPTSITVTFLSIIFTLDAKSSKVEGQDSYIAHCQHITQFCWAATKQYIEPIVVSPSFKMAISQWAQKTYEQFIILANVPRLNAHRTAESNTKQFFPQSLEMFEGIKRPWKQVRIK